MFEELFACAGTGDAGGLDGVDATIGADGTVFEEIYVSESAHFIMFHNKYKDTNTGCHKITGKSTFVFIKIRKFIVRNFNLIPPSAEFGRIRV